MYGKSDDEDEGFLMEPDIEALSSVVQWNSLYETAKRHLIAHNLEMINRVDLIEIRQKEYVTKYVDSLVADEPYEEEEDKTMDESLLTQTDIEALARLEKWPVRYETAKRHIAAYNQYMMTRIERVETHQTRYSANYVYVLRETYKLVKSAFEKRAPDEEFIVTVIGKQVTKTRPTIETWLQQNKAKGDALHLIESEMLTRGNRPTFSLSSVFYILEDNYYTGGEVLQLAYPARNSPTWPTPREH